jgi:hypothetical protein
MNDSDIYSTWLDNRDGTYSPAINFHGQIWVCESLRLGQPGDASEISGNDIGRIEAAIQRILAEGKYTEANYTIVIEQNYSLSRGEWWAKRRSK